LFPAQRRRPRLPPERDEPPLDELPLEELPLEELLLEEVPLEELPLEEPLPREGLAELDGFLGAGRAGLEVDFCRGAGRAEREPAVLGEDRLLGAGRADRPGVDVGRRGVAVEGDD
jgi:hypothetical protein